MVFHCCVPNCTKTNRDTKFHRFPVDEKECHQWLMLIGRQDLQTMPLERVKKNYRVCDIHFRPEDRVDSKYFSRQGFIKGSLPMLYMPITTHHSIGVSGRAKILVWRRPKRVGELKYQGMQSHHQTPHLGELPSGPSYQTLGKPSEVQPVAIPNNVLVPEASHFSKRSLDEAFGEELIAGPSHVETKKARNMGDLSSDSSNQGLEKPSEIVSETAVKLDKENINNRTCLQEAPDFVESGELLKKKINSSTMKFLHSEIELQQKKIPWKVIYYGEQNVCTLNFQKS